MNRYLKSFGISFILHAAAVGLGVCVTLGDVVEEKDLLVVDFSAIAFTKYEEGGELPIAGLKTETQAPAPAADPERPPPPVPQTPAPEPPIPLIPEPEPPPPPEPVVAQKAVPVPAKPAPRPVPAPKPTQPPARRPESADNRSVQSGSAMGAGGDAGAGSGAEARGIGAGRGAGRDQGLPRGYIKANFNYILTRIQRNLDYPSQARRMHLSGVAKFSFIITLDGDIEDLTLMESSGHPLLDNAAFKAIQDAAPFPAPPVPARIIVPIQFRLR